MFEQDHFKYCVSEADVKAYYRTLAMQNHPDRGGLKGAMQEINRQYQEALKRFDGKTSVGSDNQEHTYKYKQDVEENLVEIIDQVLSILGLDPAVEFWLIGSWLWVIGATKPYKDSLKGIAFKWHSKREAWYYHQGAWHGRNSNGSLAHLAGVYGAQNLGKTDEKTKRARAIS